MVDAPMAAESSVRPPAARPACPRCGAPITGDYKFCPACAARLRVGVGGEAEIPLAKPSRWKTVVLVLVAALLVSALTTVGVYLFHPDWFQRPPLESTPAAPASEAVEYETPAFDVARIASDLVEIPGNGFAFRVSIDSAAIGETDRQKILDRDRTVEFVDAYVWYSMRISRYETTRGQYDAFLRDVYTHPERLPPQWKREMIAEAYESDAPDDLSPEAFILRNHIPFSWQIVDERSHDEKKPVVGWTLADRDRNLPVGGVSFNEATAFCEWASERLGVTLRLPYRMEWVRAARAGTARLFPWGDARLIYACNNLGNFARPQFVHFAYSVPPGTGGATPEGLYSMAGNVAELTRDHKFTVADIPRPGQPPAHVLYWGPLPDDAPFPAVAYGGSYKSGIDDCQVESTGQYLPSNDNSHEDVGFRVMADPNEDK